MHVNYIDASDLVSHGKVLLNEEQVELIKNNLQNEDTPAKKEKSKKKHRISNNYLGQVAKIVGMSYWTVLLYARKAGWTTGKRKETQLTDEQKAELLEAMKIKKARGNRWRTGTASTLTVAIMVVIQDALQI